MKGSTMIRNAILNDAKSIQSLINKYAEQELMLPRSLNQLYDNIRDFKVVEIDGVVKGCCALHFAWEDLAEIKALAVDDSLKGAGWGKKLMNACLEDAKSYEVKNVFALTYVPEFFLKSGFKKIDKKELPQKIWQECINCIKFPDCNEEAVMKTITEF